MEYSDFEYLITLIQAILIFIGLLGNILSIIIFSRKTFQNNSISTYCRALAIFDCIIIVELIQNIGQLYSKFTFSIINQNDAFCKIFSYFITMYSGISAWILVAFSIDKMLSMSRNSRLILKKKWFQWSIIAVIFLINIFLYLEIPIFLIRHRINFYYDTVYCDVSSLEFFRVLIIGYLFETDIIPFFIMLITSIVTIWLLYKSRNALSQSGNIHRKRKFRDAKYAISSLTFNFMFIALKIPLVIAYTKIAYNTEIDLYFYEISLFLFFVNASSNFYVHFVTNSIFRKEFFVIVKLKRDETEISLSGGGNIYRGRNRNKNVLQLSRFPINQIA